MTPKEQEFNDHIYEKEALMKESMYILKVVSIGLLSMYIVGLVVVCLFTYSYFRFI